MAPSVPGYATTDGRGMSAADVPRLPATPWEYRLMADRLAQALVRGDRAFFEAVLAGEASDQVVLGLITRYVDELTLRLAAEGPSVDEFLTDRITELSLRIVGAEIEEGSHE